MKTTKAILVLAGVLCLLFYPAISKADMIYSLTSDHMTGGAGTPPFGTVALAENGSGGVLVTVTLNGTNDFVRTGSGSENNFLFNGAGFGVALVDISGSGLTATGGTIGGIHADGTGYWDFGVFITIQEKGGTDRRHGPIVFTVANATIADLTHPNNGYIFAADMISGQTGNTGMVDVSVPEPGILILLGIAMSAIGMASWRISKI